MPHHGDKPMNHHTDGDPRRSVSAANTAHAAARNTSHGSPDTGLIPDCPSTIPNASNCADNNGEFTCTIARRLADARNRDNACLVNVYDATDDAIPNS